MASLPPTMNDLFALALERGASDLHLKAGQAPILRIAGVIAPTELASVSRQEVLDLANQIMDAAARQEFAQIGCADFAFMMESGERFRVNVFRQRGCASLAARHVSRVIPTFQELHLPVAPMERLARIPHGLVIFAGVTGSGKSTSIASCLDYINQTRRCHIITIEDPIEYVFEDKQAIINQREVGIDVPSFGVALKYLPREDPDVVLVGEMRDRETCESVLRAAEGTGRLVFTTLHASRAPGAITRLVDLFTDPNHHLVRQVLADNLVAVVCQKLVMCADAEIGRIPTTEVMFATPPIRKMILEGDENGMAAVMASAGDVGMHDFTQDLARLVREEWITPKVAYDVAPNPEALKMAIRGITAK